MSEMSFMAHLPEDAEFSSFPMGFWPISEIRE
jgi:hypothetical protein